MPYSKTKMPAKQSTRRLWGPPMTLMLMAMALASQPQGAEAGAGVIGCIACATEWCPVALAGCTTTCSFGAWLAPLCIGACVAAGCGVPCGAACALSPTCFKDEIKFITPDGEKSASLIKMGDSVLDKDSTWTTVTENEYIPDPVEMTTLHFEDPMADLTVTSSHWIYVDNGTNFLPARDVKEGMIVPRLDKDANPRVAKVTKSFTGEGHWALATESCSAFANNIIATTMCMNKTAAVYKHAYTAVNGSATTRLAVRQTQPPDPSQRAINPPTWRRTDFGLERV